MNAHVAGGLKRLNFISGTKNRANKEMTIICSSPFFLKNIPNECRMNILTLLKNFMEIYTLVPRDWEKYKELRLECLLNEPEAFGSSYEKSSQKNDADWKAEFEDPGSFIMVVSDAGQIVAMVGAYQEAKVKMKHMAYIWGVYVRKSYRGRGIGKKLMETALDFLAKNKEIEKVDLNVNTEQLSAVRLYEKLGFTIAGTLHKELKVAGKYYDEYMMEKFLR